MTRSPALRATADEALFGAPDVVAPREPRPATLALAASSGRVAANDDVRPDPLRASAAQVAPARSRRVRPRALVLCLLAVVAGAALVANRRIVVALAPATAGAWARIGLPVNPRGLEWKHVQSRVIEDGHLRVLVVDGEIGNLRGKENRLPDIMMTVRSVDGRTLYSWTAPPPKQALAPEESVYFRARLASPPADGVEVKTQFVAAATPALRR